MFNKHAHKIASVRFVKIQEFGVVMSLVYRKKGWLLVDFVPKGYSLFCTHHALIDACVGFGLKNSAKGLISSSTQEPKRSISPE